MGIRFGILLALFSSALSAAPRLVLSASTINVTPVAPGSNGPAQTVEAMNAGNGSLNLTAQASASWLSATIGAAGPCRILSGTCNQIAITLSTASLAAGTYNEFIILTDPNAIDSPQQIAVNVTVAGVPNSITLYVGPVGSGESTAYSFIYPASPVTGTASTTSGGNWLSFVPAGNSIVGLPNSIQVSARSGQASGTYTGSVVISGSSQASDNKTVSVTLVVTTAPIVDLSSLSTVQIPGYVGGKSTSYLTIDTVQSPGSTAAPLTITGASVAGSFLSAAVYNANTISITADATGLSAAGIYNGTVTIASNAANNAAVSIPVAFIVYPSGTNVIFTNGIVNPATFVAEPFAPGEIVALFGVELAAPGTGASNPGLPPLATNLGGAQVLVNGAPAPLFYVSPGQINFQIPYSLTPGQTATVQVVSGSAPGNLRPLTIAANSPRLLVLPGNYGIAVNGSDGSLVLPSSIAVPPYNSHPARPGDAVVIYGVGFGQTSPPATEGIAATVSPLENALLTSFVFGGPFMGNPVTATAAFSGLTPTAVGLYQVNVVLPPDIPLLEALPVTVTVGSAASNTFYIATSANGQ